MSVRRAQDERLEGTPDGNSAITGIMDVPDAPTIGTATDGGTGTTVSVTFTAAATGGTPTSYTVTSSPGSISGTGASSPITVSGLTAGTAYTFTVTATNSNGTGAASAASNSVTPVVPNAYESIATVTVGSGGSSTVTFSSIPGTYAHLQVRYVARSGRARTANGSLYIQLNGNYLTASHRLFGTTTASADAASGGLDNGGGQLFVPGSTAAASIFGPGVIDILDYASTNKTKVYRALNGDDLNGEGYAAISSGLWNSTSAITSITFGSVDGGTNIPQYSTFALYGIKGS